MNELVKKDQVISVVPQDFRNSNKGKVTAVCADEFSIEVMHAPKGLLLNNLMEFYSQTQHGVLYFESDVIKIEDNVITVANPIKHRFLQRRQFTRIKFLQQLELKAQGDSFSITTLDLSAGGMKITSAQNLNIELEYNICLPLSDDQQIECKFQPIRIEKNDDGFYTLSGRFQNLSNIDKMTLVQFCMKKNMENVNK
jgi:c-di-GMP-binding flagellar brake protein YcgR